MTAYSALAAWYDELTRDVPYAAFADYYELLFAEHGGETKLLLDLCCGTGTLACLMAERGYEMIAADASADMLMSAREKASALSAGKMPLFINQSAQELDLYGTVDAAVCALDSLNHITDETALEAAIGRVALFTAPGGVFVFDVNTPYKLRRMDGQVYLDETEDSCCVWRTFYAPGRKICTYQVDLFRLNANGSWDRAFEEHRERAWGREELETYLTEAGFGAVTVTGDLTSRPPAAEEDRWIFRCQKPVRPR